MTEQRKRLLVKDISNEAADLRNAILFRDEAVLMNILAKVFSLITFGHYAKQQENESFHHSLLFIYCAALFPDSRMEEPESHGIPDITLVLESDTYVVIELKYLKNKGQPEPEKELNNLANKALKAVMQKGYGGKYSLIGKKVIQVGVGVFDRGKVKALFEAEHDTSDGSPS